MSRCKEASTDSVLPKYGFAFNPHGKEERPKRLQQTNPTNQMVEALHFVRVVVGFATNSWTTVDIDIYIGRTRLSLHHAPINEILMRAIGIVLVTAAIVLALSSHGVSARFGVGGADPDQLEIVSVVVDSRRGVCMHACTWLRLRLLMLQVGLFVSFQAKQKVKHARAEMREAEEILAGVRAACETAANLQTVAHANLCIRRRNRRLRERWRTKSPVYSIA